MNSSKVVPLHHHLEHLEACIDVLVEEWPRNRAAREHSLKKSSERFPNLVYLKDDQVIGHSMLSQVVGNDEACFVESVVVSRCLRGKGLGRDLMQKTEEHAQSLGIKTIYLTTHDKQGFYERVGYQFCDPVFTCSSKAGFMNNSEINSMLQKMALSQSLPTISPASTKKKENHLEDSESSAPPGAPVAPPPPPPPLVRPKDVPSKDKISWMKKDLT